MIERRWIEQLDSPDVQSRKIAVQQLARSRDKEAIRYLEASERGDADASVRDLARKAIVFIQRANEDAPPAQESAPAAAPAVPAAQENAPESAPETPSADTQPPLITPDIVKPAPSKTPFVPGSILAEYANQPDPTPPPPPVTPDAEPKPKSKKTYGPGSIMAEYANQPVPPPPAPIVEDPDAPPRAVKVAVPEARVKAASISMSLAGRASFENQNGKAAKYLVDAFKQNPNLQFDNYAIGMAATITGLYKTDAVKAVMDGSILDLFDKSEITGKPKKKTDDDVPAAPPAGWGTAIIDLFVYGLIHAFIVGVVAIIAIQVVLGALQNDPALQAELAANQLTLSTVIDQVAGIAIVGLILYALLYGLFAMIGLLVQAFFIHLVARFILGGDGTLANQIHQTSLFLAIMTVVIIVFQIAANFLLPVLADASIGLILSAISFGLSIFYFMGHSSRIGKAYEMSGTRGCVAIVLSGILIAVISFACVFALIQASGTVMTNVIVITAVP